MPLSSAQLQALRSRVAAVSAIVGTLQADAPSPTPATGSLRLKFDRVVTIGSGGPGGFNLNASGGPVSLSFVGGVGTDTLTYALSRTIGAAETCALDFTQPGDGVKGELDVLSFAGVVVINGSASQEPTWGVIADIAFTQGIAGSRQVLPANFDTALHEIRLADISAALPSGVTLDPAGALDYDGSGPVAAVAGVVLDVVDMADQSGGAAPDIADGGAVIVADGLQSFAQRIAQPGVVRHFSFADPAHLGAGPGGYGYGYNYGWYDDGIPGDHPVHDTSIHPGSGGSLRCELDATRGGGAWVTNFSSDLATRFNAGDEFFVQWRQRFNSAMLGPNVGLYGSWKQCLVSSGDTDYTVSGVAGSCRCCEICLTSYEFASSTSAYNSRFPIAYHRCPNCGGTLNLMPGFSGEGLLLQNMMPAPYCSTGNTEQGPGQGGSTGCFHYVADEWMTFQIGITCGNRVGNELQNSRVRIWGQRQGQASVALIDTAGPGYSTPFTLTVPATDPGYGKMWFTMRNPYGRDTLMQTWYSELIISTQRIPDAL